MLVTRLRFPAKLSQIYIDRLSNLSMTRSLDNIKELHFSNFKYKLSHLSIYPSLIHSSVVTDNSFLSLCSLQFPSLLDHLVLHWTNLLL